jgi:hypothetical protein
VDLKIPCKFCWQEFLCKVTSDDDDDDDDDGDKNDDNDYDNNDNIASSTIQ